MATHDLVCGGVRRRIGNRTITLVWGDPWLLDRTNPMIQTIMPPQLRGIKVVSLIDPLTQSWDLPF